MKLSQFCKGSLGVLLIGFGGFSVQAQPLTAIRPLPGYQCMALNLSPQEMMTTMVPMLAAPDPNAQKIGFVPATVFVAESSPINGYRMVIRFDGRKGWVADHYLKPWVNPGGNGQKCVPSVMSNRSIGYGS